MLDAAQWSDAATPTVDGGNGNFSRSELIRVVTASRAQVRACFETPSCQSGQIQVTVTVTTGGRFEHVMVSSSTFDAAVNACVVAVLGDLVVSDYRGAEVRVRVPYSSSCGDEDGGAVQE